MGWASRCVSEFFYLPRLRSLSLLKNFLDSLLISNEQGIYLAGTILINQPWGSDGYSALDTTLLDQHFGNIQTWRDAISEIHRRGMYVVFDNTIAT
jgi:alpha-1,3-glucan synthase